MTTLDGPQFAQYSGRTVERRGGRFPGDTRVEPLPASMERHAPGEYQPTLPGMEKMLKGEMTSSAVVFKHPVETERWEDNTGESHIGDVPHSNWGFLTRNFNSTQMKSPASSLRPSQDWLDDNYLHSPVDKGTLQFSGPRPKVENIRGKNVIQDGHHRAAREILGGAKRVDIDRWGGKGY